MKTYKCVYTRAGNENADSALHLLCLLSNFADDLNAEITCCCNWDDNRLVTVSKYRVIDVTLPDWLPFETYKADQFAWQLVFTTIKYRKNFNIDTDITFEVADLLRSCESHALRVGLADLLFCNLRSDFRKSLRQQVFEWLAASPDARKYNFPLSDRQLQSILPYGRRSEDMSLYYSSRYNEMKGL